jgi:excisionase family DNA binding protein
MSTTTDLPRVSTPAGSLPSIEAGSLLDLLREVVHQPAAFTAIQAAKYLGMSKPSLYRGVASGQIPGAVRTPGGPRWRKKCLDKYLDGLRTT